MGSDSSIFQRITICPESFRCATRWSRGGVVSTITRMPGRSTVCGRSWPERSIVRRKNQYSPSPPIETQGAAIGFRSAVEPPSDTAVRRDVQLHLDAIGDVAGGERKAERDQEGCLSRVTIASGIGPWAATAITACLQLPSAARIPGPTLPATYGPPHGWYRRLQSKGFDLYFGPASVHQAWTCRPLSRIIDGLRLGPQ